MFLTYKDLKLKNRIVLSPLTRACCDPVTHETGPMQVEYYSQRAGAGLIITEAVTISVQGFGWYGAPCMYTEAHRDSWKPVVEAVHAKGSKIFFQIWYIGRQGHPSFIGDVVGPSAIAPVSGHTRNVNAEKAPYEVFRELKTNEIPGIFCKSACLAKETGFDGIDIHAANGCLPDTRPPTSLVEALLKEWPANRIGFTLSPNGFYGDTGSVDNYDMCRYVADKLGKYGPLTKPYDVKTHFKGTVSAANSYERDTAEGVLRSGAADFVIFGRLYISNHDLLNATTTNEPAGFDTWFGTCMPVPRGYIDFP
ncbi:12-oxophytodienoate reductase [Phytophthora megakarya]|uniref:12-oxophytodienoate reductase n=1 Tax=Phytophthora megakarya TaxID=4795 RepID=A0A225VSC5_9STRA|nr:12-oxophytodienoate reductase [Phytophthora megakarya]